MAKSRDAFRTISEVADWLGVQAHVLRFWESKFTHVKPVKRAGGRRYYRPADMLLLGGIKRLLHDDGMTIKGLQKLLREEGVAHVQGFSQSLEQRAPDDLSEAANVIRLHEPPIEARPVVSQIDMDLSEPPAKPAPVVEATATSTEAPESETVDPISATEPLILEQPDLAHESSLSHAPGPLSKLARVARFDPADLPAAARVARNLKTWIERQAAR
ncbi:MerR family transcriptional regulator [Ruegeria sp. 2205SS24-7]|uniref:MerR family transcriptional regulator n=1 Tax=Ruegeria discodermiae TaxID=3064389 RepID=UPI002741806C|nr:MerR family transcriptional regulator [Ruegeria sp. 2205SS24-7]MDP5216037.1 MerR family transcriptional regulator [Ruegeria sp. 2205SS24-7]